MAFTAVMADTIKKSCGQPPRTRPDRVLADKAYSSKKIRNALRWRGIKATIPEPSTQIAGRVSRGSNGGRPPRFDKEICKTRNTMERAINWAPRVPGGGDPVRQREFVYKGTVDGQASQSGYANPPTKIPGTQPVKPHHLRRQ